MGVWEYGSEFKYKDTENKLFIIVKRSALSFLLFNFYFLLFIFYYAKKRIHHNGLH
jgi:hypothetical protein